MERTPPRSSSRPLRPLDRWLGHWPSAASILLVQARRGSFGKMEYIDELRVLLTYTMPLAELIVDFYDQLKTRTQGYASLDYQFDAYQPADLVKLDVLVNALPVDALSMIIHQDKAYQQGRSLIEKLPAESVNSGLSSIITLATPGVAADSNGLYHPLGEHAEQSFSVDGQPISDQQTRQFSNQISANSIQSMEIISGVPPAEFGDKASLVVRTVTKSGLQAPNLFGSLSGGYGSFGTSDASLTLGYGTQRFGNFLSIDGVNGGRFLDPPGFQPLHAHGNAENLFDRIDFQPGPNDNFHINLGAARSWFQIPNQFDQQAAGQDQRQQIRTFNIAPSYTHVFSPAALIGTDVYVQLRQASQFATIAPCERNRLASHAVGVGHCTNDVCRIAGAADGHHEVILLREVLELLFENALVAHIV